MNSHEVHKLTNLSFDMTKIEINIQISEHKVNSLYKISF